MNPAEIIDKMKPQLGKAATMLSTGGWRLCDFIVIATHPSSKSYNQSMNERTDYEKDDNGITYMIQRRPDWLTKIATDGTDAEKKLAERTNVFPKDDATTLPIVALFNDEAIAFSVTLQSQAR